MKEIKTIGVFPAKIVQNFNPLLLAFPKPKFRDDAETLWKVWEYIEDKLWKKLDKCSGKKAKCEKLKKEFMKLYEQAKNKEKELEAKKKHPTQMPFYYFKSIGRQGDSAFRSALFRQISRRSSIYTK